MKRPTSRRDLWLTVYELFGVRLPHRVFSRGHSTPLDFVADGFFNPGRDIAAWANRRGARGASGSILAALEYRFADRPMKGRVLAGSEDQARTLYEYWQRWCWEILRDRLRGDPGRLITRLDNGDFEILAASPKRVRGPGIQRLYWDEVDEIDPSIMAASVGALTTLNGVPARTVAMSTWHHAHGPMGQLVEHAESRGVSLHRWNIWEAIARCPRERHQRGRGCSACVLGDVCLAKAVECDPRSTAGIAARADGLLAIDDAIKQYSHWSSEQWQAEAECRRPTLAGLVYPTFDRRHVEAELDFQAHLPICRAVDWGLNDFVCLWIQQDKRGRVLVVDELWTRQTTVHEVAAKIRRALDDGVAVEATYCDPAGRNRNDQTGYSDVDVFAGCGIPCRYTLNPWAREIRNGVNLIRAALKPAVGPPRLVIAGKCRQLIRAFESYKLRHVNGEYVDEPVKPQPCDHPMDALRYYFVNRFAPMRAQAQPMRYTG